MGEAPKNDWVDVKVGYRKLVTSAVTGLLTLVVLKLGFGLDEPLFGDVDVAQAIAVVAAYVGGWAAEETLEIVGGA